MKQKREKVRRVDGIVQRYHVGPKKEKPDTTVNRDEADLLTLRRIRALLSAKAITITPVRLADDYPRLPDIIHKIKDPKIYEVNLGDVDIYSFVSGNRLLSAKEAKMAYLIDRDMFENDKEIVAYLKSPASPIDVQIVR